MSCTHRLRFLYEQLTDVKIDTFTAPLNPYTELDIIDVTKRTVRNWVYEAAEAIADETGNDDWRDLKPHDLRRYYCSHLVREGFAAAEVMEWSGHEDYSTFRDHYWLPSDDVVSSKLDNADF